MKDEYKILIGAVVVIIIVLVGAFALSGSGGPGPSVTPTAEPTITPTPTAVPGGEGGTPTVTPEPSVVPSVTPTEPESGVRLTEFGYWITYPPLGPQNWSSPPPKGPQNIVYFDPISDDVSTIFVKGVSVADLRLYGETIVHRDGDLSGTVNVTIQTSNSSNAWLVVPAIAPDFRYEYYVYREENLTYEGGNIYTLTFGPGVSEQEIYVPIGIYYLSDNVDIANSVPPQGTVKLTITGVDGGYSIGAKKDFTVNINPPLPVVRFVYSMGSLYDETGCTVTRDGDVYNISVQLNRLVDTSQPLDLNIVGNVYYVPEGYLDIKVDDFNAGSATTYVYVIYDTSYMSSAITDESPYLYLTIIESSSYLTVYPNVYNLDLRLPT
jgi:hypothetical protein